MRDTKYQKGLRSSKYTDLCQYSLNASEGMLFRFICFPQRNGYFSSVLRFLRNKQLYLILTEIVHQPFHMFPHRYELSPQSSQTQAALHQITLQTGNYLSYWLQQLLHTNKIRDVLEVFHSGKKSVCRYIFIPVSIFSSLIRPFI